MTILCILGHYKGSKFLLTNLLIDVDRLDVLIFVGLSIGFDLTVLSISRMFQFRFIVSHLKQVSRLLRRSSN